VAQIYAPTLASVYTLGVRLFYALFVVKCIAYAAVFLNLCETAAR
jgi:hypothetical protein